MIIVERDGSRRGKVLSLFSDSSERSLIPSYLDNEAVEEERNKCVTIRQVEAE